MKRSFAYTLIVNALMAFRTQRAQRERHRTLKAVIVRKCVQYLLNSTLDMEKRE